MSDEKAIEDVEYRDLEAEFKDVLHDVGASESIEDVQMKFRYAFFSGVASALVDVALMSLEQGEARKNSFARIRDVVSENLRLVHDYLQGLKGEK
jgi:hypothetical protein